MGGLPTTPNKSAQAGAGGVTTPRIPPAPPTRAGPSSPFRPHPPAVGSDHSAPTHRGLGTPAPSPCQRFCAGRPHGAPRWRPPHQPSRAPGADHPRLQGAPWWPHWNSQGAAAPRPSRSPLPTQEPQGRQVHPAVRGRPPPRRPQASATTPEAVYAPHLHDCPHRPAAGPRGGPQRPVPQFPRV